jgi:putative FmdB family regulatory protein
MPSYDFTCKVCGANFERQVSFHDDLSTVTCPNGHHQVQRHYSVPSVVFKGSGWYVTDHRQGAKKTKVTATS